MKLPLRILFTIPNFDTAGSGRALLKLAKRIDRSIFEPHICCTHDRGELFAAVKASGLPVHLRQFTSPMRPVLPGLLACWKISRFFRQFDVVHSFHYSDDYSEALSARFARTKWTYVKKNMSWGSRAWRLRTWLAHGVIAQNTDMMRSFFGGQKHVRLIPIGVDTDEFRPRPPAAHLLEELRIPENALVVLSVANLVPVKGIEHLIQAFDMVSRKRPELWLIIVGDGRTPYALDLKRQASALPSNGRIVFTGKRQDVSDFHSIASLFVLPSLAGGEGGPVGVLEAMAAGLLTLASDVAGIRDQFADAPDQLFVSGSAPALAEKMDWALDLPEHALTAVIRRQHEAVRRRYSLVESIAQHEAFFRQVVQCG